MGESGGWMNLEGIMLSEISQTEKCKYCIISLIYGILKNTLKNPQKTNSYREQIFGCQKWEAKGGPNF